MDSFVVILFFIVIILARCIFRKLWFTWAQWFPFSCRLHFVFSALY